jgi:SAM-dependent methyltransferase
VPGPSDISAYGVGHTKRQVHRTMEAYYRARAGDYDRVYDIPAWQDDLAWLRRWVTKMVAGRTVLEVAAGTGYWTAAAASTAASVTACDLLPEVLAVAAARQMGSHVDFVVADAYALPNDLGRFDVVMAHLWWSHLLRQSRKEFLVGLAPRLHPGGLLLMIDQSDVEGFGFPVSRWDAEGNRYEIRTVTGCGTFEIVKNYPTDAELRQSIACMGSEVRIDRLRYLWSSTACASV